MKNVHFVKKSILLSFILLILVYSLSGCSKDTDDSSASGDVSSNASGDVSSDASGNASGDSPFSYINSNAVTKIEFEFDLGDAYEPYVITDSNIISKIMTLCNETPFITGTDVEGDIVGTRGMTFITQEDSYGMTFSSYYLFINDKSYVAATKDDGNHFFNTLMSLFLQDVKENDLKLYKSLMDSGYDEYVD